ncbi:MAG: acetyl-CoA carboxylase biotin carboxyl carrier protein [Candidatus Eisenbacteria bacterium]
MASKRKSGAEKRGKNVKNAAVKADSTGGASVAGFELGELRQLIQLVQRTGIGELELTSGGRSVRISATGFAPAATHVVSAPAPVRAAAEAAPPAAAPAPAAAAPAANDKLKAITSPMVGTFYRSPAPDADPFVENGDSVDVGQTVCIIEAMKLMNEIESEFKGRIVQILVENAQPVEFGQKLFLVEPA